jgi:hypothetical protein
MMELNIIAQSANTALGTLHIRCFKKVFRIRARLSPIASLLSWHYMAQIVMTQRPNNSFKPMPLRGTA